ncbi:MAG: hypothetical protein ABJB40_00545 [Acidobacteriota bacterium]
MNAEQLRELYEKYFYYILLADIGIGLLIGLLPLALGVARKKRNLGIIGLILSGAVGGLSPIFSLIVAAVFTVLIVRGSKKPVEVVVVNQESTDVSVSESDDQ